MKALIKHIVARAIAAVVERVYDHHDTDDIAAKAAEKVANDVRYDRSFARNVAAEIDTDDIAEKVASSFEPDYEMLSGEIDAGVLADHLRGSVVDELMEKLPTPLRALIDLGGKEPEPETAVKPELVERLLDRAVEKLLTLAGEMAESGELRE
jgi:hypothetical protein